MEIPTERDLHLIFVQFVTNEFFFHFTLAELSRATKASARDDVVA